MRPEIVFTRRLYDVEHKPRFAYARSYFLGYSDRDPELEILEKFYVDWRDYEEYVVVQNQSNSLRIEEEIDKETVEIKYSKRGLDYRDPINENNMWLLEYRIVVFTIQDRLLELDKKNASIETILQVNFKKIGKWGKV